MTKQEICQKLDEVDDFSTLSAHPEVTALAQTGIPIILPLSQIWAEGQATKKEFREEGFGLLFLYLGIVLAVAGVVRIEGIDKDYAWGALFAAAAVGVFVAGLKLRREAAAKSKVAQRRALLVEQLISGITDPQCALRLLEACYGLNGIDKIKLIPVEPIASALVRLLPRADESMFVSPSRLARLAIRQTLTKEVRTNLDLANEVVEMVGKAELTEFVADIDKLTRPWAPPSLRFQAEVCSHKLHAVIEERKRTGVLLRPSSGPDESEAVLLRPVNSSRNDAHETLVRAIQEEQ